YGGIYLDTDVEVLKSLDAFLENRAFIGFETATVLSTAVIGAEKGHPWISELLKAYRTRPFILPDGSLNLEPNVYPVTSATQALYGLKLNNALQKLGDGLAVYPSDYFSPKDHKTERLHLTSNTHAIHHFSSSWFSLGKRIRKKCHVLLIDLIGEKRCERLLAKLK
ncbi:MAG: glycosyl transferase, partial [Clostridia bacterium]|nr:glycosyl transferase [Clostridia bacterium]